MDHLPLPQDRFLGYMTIPFLASDSYMSPFHDYPQRNGWHLEFRGRDLDPKLTHTATSQASHEFGSLLQTWLYFGLLSEFLGASVDMKLFKKESESGSMLLSSEALESLVCERTYSLLEQSKTNNGPSLVQSWRDAFYENLLVTREHTLLTVVQAAKINQALSLTCLAISVLAEYLMTALSHLCDRIKVVIPVTQKWRVMTREFGTDCGIPILKSMQQKGWCAHDIALFSGAQVETVSTLWYLANLSPPKAGVSHFDCTAETCSSLRIDRNQYIQAHTIDGCSCGSVEPDHSSLASIIWSGKTPVLTFRENRVFIKEHVPGSDFIAVSHVWTDGMGNPKANSLPLCVVRELQKLVNELPKRDSTADTPFWIDTFCIPRSPLELRIEALQRLKEPYEEAASVIVIDSYLRCYPGSGVSRKALSEQQSKHLTAYEVNQRLQPVG